MSFSLTAEAQRGRDDRQQNISGFLGRLDSNRNGFIEPHEMSSRTRSYISGLGFNPDAVNRISTIVQKIEKDKQGDALKRNELEQKKQLQSYRKVPDFSTPPREQLGVPGFDGDISTMSDPELIKKFGSSAVNQGIGTMTKYDRNKDGVIDADEQKGAPWGNPSPQESDKNKDGRLSKYEIILRYYEREQAAKTAQTSAGAAQAQLLTRQNGVTVQMLNSEAAANNPTNAAARSYQQRGYVPPSQRRSTNNFSTNSNQRTFRNPSKPSNPTSETASSSTTNNSGNDRFERYVQGLMRQYDKNNDGKLDKGELGKMRTPPVGADADNDGFVTVEEYIAKVSGQPSAAANSTSSNNERVNNLKNAAEVNREEARNQSTSKSSPVSFGGLDSNEDGQIQMSEFAGEWDEAKVGEFEAKDGNGDGLITPAEWSGQAGQ